MSEDNGTRTSLPQITVLIENPRKSTNWGPLLRCCAAFGIPQIFAIGFEKCSVEGSHGAARHVEIVAFHNHEAAIKAIKNEFGFEIIGLLQGAPNAYHPRQPVGYFNGNNGETMLQVDKSPREDAVKDQEGDTNTKPIPPHSTPLHHRPFTRRTCLVVGKSTRGLPLSLAQLCDSFVHIPHQGLKSPESSASWLTIEAGLSITLHEFALWAGYGKSGQYQGQKYRVEAKRPGDDKAEIRRKQEERKQRLLVDHDEGYRESIFDEQGGDY